MRNVSHRWHANESSAPVRNWFMQLTNEIVSTSDYATKAEWSSTGSDSCLTSALTAVDTQRGA